MSLLSYKYYDTPEGQDIYKKWFVTSKYATATGGLMATADVLMYSKPEGFIKTGARYLFYLGPLVGIASAFTVTTNTMQNFRGKNDVWNYFCGGAAAGTIVGAWARSGLVVVPAAFILGVAAMIKKTAIDANWPLFPVVPQCTKNAVSVRFDYTMAKDEPQHVGWKTGTQ